MAKKDAAKKDDSLQTVAELQRSMAANGIRVAISTLSDLEPTQRAVLRQWVDDGGKPDKLPAFAQRDTFEKVTPAGKPAVPADPAPEKTTAAAKPEKQIGPKIAALMMQQDDRIIAQNRKVRRAHDDWVEAKETLSECNKVYQAEQKELSKLVDDLEAIRTGNYTTRMAFPEEDVHHPDVEAGKHRQAGTPLLDATAAMQKENQKSPDGKTDEKPKKRGRKKKPATETAADAQPGADAKSGDAAGPPKPDPQQLLQCVACNHVYIRANRQAGGCPECGSAPFTLPPGDRSGEGSAAK